MDKLIIERLKERSVTSVIHIGNELWPEFQEACNKLHCSFHFQSHRKNLPKARFDLALVTGLEKLAKKQALELLGTLRNQHVNSLWVASSPASPLKMADFISLGFKKSKHIPKEYAPSFYEYDLSNYSKRRSWNNPKHWANPQNFHLRW